MAFVGRPGGQILIDNDGPVAELYSPGPKAGAGYRIGDDERAVDAAALEVVSQCHHRHVNAIGNEADGQAVGQAQHALNDVVVPRDQLGAGVAQVSEHRQSGVDAAVSSSSDESQ